MWCSPVIGVSLSCRLGRRRRHRCPAAVAAGAAWRVSSRRRVGSAVGGTAAPLSADRVVLLEQVAGRRCCLGRCRPVCPVWETDSPDSAVRGVLGRSATGRPLARAVLSITLLARAVPVVLRGAAPLHRLDRVHWAPRAAFAVIGSRRARRSLPVPAAETAWHRQRSVAFRLDRPSLAPSTCRFPGWWDSRRSRQRQEALAALPAGGGRTAEAVAMDLLPGFGWWLIASGTGLVDGARTRPSAIAVRSARGRSVSRSSGGFGEGSESLCRSQSSSPPHSAQQSIGIYGLEASMESRTPKNSNQPMTARSEYLSDPRGPHLDAAVSYRSFSAPSYST